MDDEIQKLAVELYEQKSVLIMGRGYHYATCLEGALVSEAASSRWKLPVRSLENDSDCKRGRL